MAKEIFIFPFSNRSINKWVWVAVPSDRLIASRSVSERLFCLSLDFIKARFSPRSARRNIVNFRRNFDLRALHG